MSIFDQLQEPARLLPPPPAASRLEVGWLARVLLRVTIPPAEPAPYGGFGMTALTGLPIVVNDDLDPAELRLLDRAGEVLKSGTMAMSCDARTVPDK